MKRKLESIYINSLTINTCILKNNMPFLSYLSTLTNSIINTPCTFRLCNHFIFLTTPTNLHFFNIKIIITINIKINKCKRNIIKFFKRISRLLFWHTFLKLKTKKPKIIPMCLRCFQCYLLKLLFYFRFHDSDGPIQIFKSIPKIIQ